MFLKNGQNLSVPSITCQDVQEDDHNDDDDDDDDDDDGYYVRVKIEVSDIPCLLGNLTCSSSVSNVHTLANSLTVTCYSEHALCCSHEWKSQGLISYILPSSRYPSPPQIVLYIHTHSAGWINITQSEAS